MILSLESDKRRFDERRDSVSRQFRAYSNNGTAAAMVIREGEGAEARGEETRGGFKRNGGKIHGGE